MNKIQWNLPSSFGSSFKLNITKTNKLFNHNSIKLMRQFSQPNSLNTTVLNNSRRINFIKKSNNFVCII
jgi:hypothetical protein